MEREDPQGWTQDFLEEGNIEKLNSELHDPAHMADRAESEGVDQIALLYTPL